MVPVSPIHHQWFDQAPRALNLGALHLGAPSLGAGAAAMLAQSKPVSEVLFWCGVALVVVVGSALAGRWMIRRLREPHEPYQGPPSGFDTDDLRILHQQGRLTDEEHQRVQAVIQARHRHAMLHGPSDDPAGGQAAITPDQECSDKPPEASAGDGGTNPAREP
jgi:hypothetical protein